ncbi:MAG: GAF domain-containing protein [Gemmatimonadota bacterium]
MAIEERRHGREGARGAALPAARRTRRIDAGAQLSATREILRVIPRSQGDAQPVFEMIATAALKLCGATSANVFTFDGRLVQIAALAVENPTAVDALREVFPRPADRGTAASRAVLTRGVVAIHDVLADREYVFKRGAQLGFRSVLCLPLLRDGSPIGAIAVGRARSGPFSERQIALLQTFADQAMIAIENSRLFHETRQALERQTATAEVLRVISGSVTDTQPVFDVIAERAAHLTGAKIGWVFTYDGEWIHSASAYGLTPDSLAAAQALFPMRPGGASYTSRAIRDGKVMNVADALAETDPEYATKAVARVAGYRSVLSVPMFRGRQVLGAISVNRAEVGEFADAEVELLRTFADQAVIAIENSRMAREREARNQELTEALEQRTATGEVLRVISSSPRDVQPVFEAIAAAAAKLCSASVVNLVTFDGKTMHLGALANLLNREGADRARRLFPRPPGADTAAGRAVLARSVIAIPDVLDDREYAFREGPQYGVRSVLGIPLMRESAPIGALAICRPEPGSFPESQVALLKTFADQAVIAIENARLFRELEARTSQLTRSVEQLRALGEVGQAVSSTLDLETVLSTIVARAAPLAGMDGGAVYEYEEGLEQFRLHATDRMPEELVESLRSAAIPKGEGAIGRLAVTREPAAIGDLADEHAYQSRVRAILLRLGYRSLLAVPLLREDRLLGGLVVHRRHAGEFAPEVIDLLKAFATQSALAIQNARLFREIEEKSRQLEIASHHKSAFLANMSHELRTPLNAIIGFTRIVMRRSQERLERKQFENLEKILASAQQLLGLINAVLDLAKVEAGRVDLTSADVDLGPVLEQCLRTIEPLVPDTVTTVRAFADGLPRVVADEDKLRQIVMNLLSNAARFTERGSIRLDARVTGAAIEIAVADTGIGIPGDKLESIFEEFEQVGASRTREHGGTGLGLAIARRLARLMGGDVRAQSTLGAGSTFTLTLPLRRHIDAP